MVLQAKLKSIQMLNFETVPTYLDRFTQIRDELAAFGEIVDLDFLVRTALNSFSKPWGSFVRGIVTREVMPTWERLGRFHTRGVEVHPWVFMTTAYA
jgi:hypothetical protein